MTTNLSSRPPAGRASAAPAAKGSAPAAPAARRLGYPGVLLLLAVALALLSLVRIVTDEKSLTATGQWTAALTFAVPIGLAGLAGLWAERSGVVNIGLEGMMMLGLFGAGWAGWQWGPWAAVFAGVVGGALGGLVHAVATVSFGVKRVLEMGGRMSSEAVIATDEDEYDLRRNTRMMVIMSIIAVMLSSLISPAASRSLRFFRARALRNIIRCLSSSET